MAKHYGVNLSTIIESHNLNVLVRSSDFDTYEITTYDITRPALPLAGFFGEFQPERVQIMGRVEAEYLKTLDEVEREKRLEAFFSYIPKVVIACNRTPPDPAIVDMARKYDCNLFTTDLTASTFMAQIITTLRTHLAPRQTVHGVLIDVHGEGLLIMGDSGVGKSEVALELVKRGHRLIADDSVELRRINRDLLFGTAPDMIRYLMELRGIGLIDVRRIFGIGSVQKDSKIDLVVEFVPWEDGVEYDRLGLGTEYTSFLGVKVPKVTIPVAPGRNLAIILEVAAMNNHQKRMGINTAEEFVRRYDEGIDNGGF